MAGEEASAVGQVGRLAAGGQERPLVDLSRQQGALDTGWVGWPTGSRQPCPCYSLLPPAATLAQGASLAKPCQAPPAGHPYTKHKLSVHPALLTVNWKKADWTDHTELEKVIQPYGDPPTI